jgi:hypothetical protein
MAKEIAGSSATAAIGKLLSRTKLSRSLSKDYRLDIRYSADTTTCEVPPAPAV